MQRSPPVGGDTVGLLYSRSALAGWIHGIRLFADVETFVRHRQLPQVEFVGRAGPNRTGLCSNFPVCFTVLSRSGPGRYHHQLQSYVLLAALLSGGAKGKAATAHHRTPQLDAGKSFSFSGIISFRWYSMFSDTISPIIFISILFNPLTPKATSNCSYIPILLTIISIP